MIALYVIAAVLLAAGLGLRWGSRKLKSKIKSGPK